MKQDEKGIEDAKAKRFHEDFARYSEECDKANWRPPSSTDYGRGYGDGHTAGRSQGDLALVLAYESGQAAGESGLRGVWFLQGEDFHYPAIPGMYPVTIQDAFGAGLVVERLFVEGDGWDVEDGWKVIAYAEIEPYTPPQPSSEEV